MIVIADSIGCYKYSIFPFGAGGGILTLGFNLGKVAL